MPRSHLPTLWLMFLCSSISVAQESLVSFSKDVRPIFIANCISCHQSAKDEGDYLMTEFTSLMKGGESGDPAVVPGDPDSSYLVELITPQDGEAEMPPGDKALSADEVGLIRRWIREGAKNDYEGSSAIYSIDSPPQYSRRPNITALDVSPDGKWLAVNGLNEILILATEKIELSNGSIQTGKIEKRLIGLSPRIESIAFSPDGQYLAASGGTPGEMGEIQIWNVTAEKLELSTIVSNDTAYGVSWSPDGKLVAFGLTDTTLRAIDAQSGEQVFYQSAHDDWIRDTAFSVDGKQLVSVGRDMSCKLNEVPTQRFIDNITSITPGVLKGGIASVVRHPTRDEIVIGGADGVPKVYRMNRITKRVIGDDANLVRLLPKMEGRIQSVAVSPDGKRIAAAASLNGAGFVQVYSYEFDPAVSAQLKAILAKQPQQWNADERKVVEAYNSAGVKTLSKRNVPETGLYEVAFHPQRKWIATAGRDGLIRIIDPESGSLLASITPVRIQTIAKAPGNISRLQFRSSNNAKQTGPKNPSMDLGTTQLADLKVFPSSIEFHRADEYVQLVVQAVAADGATFDITETAVLAEPDGILSINGSLLQPIGSGKSQIVVSYGGIEKEVPVVVNLPDTQPVPDFRRDVNPILTKLGCNAGTCHGSAAGKMGFKLSLRGYDPIFDVRAFTDDMGSRRTNQAAAIDSLMLKKPTGTVPHMGGKLLDKDSKYYAIIKDWIENGTPLNLKLPKVESVEIFPKNPILPAGKFSQQVRVVATYTDGTFKDVTREAFIEIGDIEIAAVTESKVTALRRGETPLLARFEGAFTATTLTVMGDRSGFAWKQPDTWGAIDELVANKWKVMKIQPSELCTDAEFVRRVYLDLTGLPPTLKEVEAFLNDSRPVRAKRDALVDQLVGNDAFVEHWSNKWADLMQVNRKYLGVEGAKAFRDWIREQVRVNRPYNEFAYDVLTASGSNRENPAASYYKIHRTPEDAMENTTHLFLATRFNCNKCHDHPFERWTQDQYFETAAFFAQIERKKDPKSGDRRVGGSAVEAAKPLYEIIADAPQGELKHERTGLDVQPDFPFECNFPASEKASRREQLASWITSPDNPYFATSYVNRLWGYLLGTGLIEPLDDLRAGNPATNPELLELLRKEFVDHNFDTRHVVRMICKSRTYQLSIATNEFNADDNRNYSHAIARRLPAEVLFDSIHFVTGSQLKIPGVQPGTRAAALPDSGARLPSGFLSTLGRPARESVCECERSNDLQLGSVLAMVSGPDVARALADPSNALQKLIAEEPDDRQVVNQLYLRILNRPATEGEIELAIESFGKIKGDHQRLVQLRDQRQKEVDTKRPQLEQERLAAIDGAQSDLDQIIQKLDPKLLEKESARNEKIAAATKRLNDYKKSATSFESWTQEQLALTQWHPFLPTQLESKAGKKLTVRPDHSILAEQKTGQDTYTLIGQTDLGGITHLRLELLPHDGFKGKGPGLAENGNLVLSEFIVEIASPEEPERWLPVPIRSSIANFEQQGFPIGNTTDGKIDRSGWAVNGTAGKESWATYQFILPIGYRQGTRFRMKLIQNFDDQHQVGRFRISFSQSPKSVGLSITESLAQRIANQKTKPLTKDEQSVLRTAFTRSDPRLRELQQALKVAQTPLMIPKEIVAAREKLARVSKPLAEDSQLTQLELDVQSSATQLKNKRLTAAQDLAWALLNSPSFLFNH